jgi:hypothetical protein
MLNTNKMTYDTKKLEQMCKTIDGFKKKDHVKILEIIKKKDNYNLSENNNGTFVHMKDLSEDTLIDIDNYINYILKTEGDISIIENTKETLKNNLNSK